MSRRSKRSARNNQLSQVDPDSDDDSPSRSQKRRRSNRAKPSQSSQVSTVYDLDELPSQRSQKSKAAQLAPEELTYLVGNVIRYIFTIDHSNAVIQRQHIVNNVLANHSKHYQSIITQVESQLLKIFGYNLIQINDTKYILVNDVPNSIPHLLFKENERSEMVLLLLILSHIMSVGDTCKEETLWAFLEQLEIQGDKHNKHPYFGDVQTLVTVNFIKQLYLQRLKINDTDPPKYEYRWGIRADNELSKEEVLEFMSKVYRRELT